MHVDSFHIKHTKITFWLYLDWLGQLPTLIQEIRHQLSKWKSICPEERPVVGNLESERVTHDITCTVAVEYRNLSVG